MNALRVFACILLTSSSLVASPLAVAQLLSSQEETVVAQDGTMLKVTTGTIAVPERHPSASNERRLTLAYIRIRLTTVATTNAHVVLAGGPGDSGVGLVRGLARQGGAAMLALFDDDIIGVDQRGTGSSIPNLALATRYDLPPDAPGSAEAWLPRIEAVSRDAASTLRDQGIDLAAFNTRESADDVEDVRRALGYEQLTLWGRSYGTHLALAFLRQHPERTQRLLLFGPEGPDQTWKSPLQADLVLQTLAERLGQQDLPMVMRRVLSRLVAEPVTVSVVDPRTRERHEVTLSAFDVQWITAQALGNARTLATLPAAYRRMDHGDFTAIASLAVVLRQRQAIGSAMKQAMDLSSGASNERRLQVERESRAALLGDALNFPNRYLADAWQITPLDDAFRAPVTSDIPTLILVGDLDARTPIANAREIASSLPNAKVVVVENATHDFDVFGSAPIRELAARFLRGDEITISHLALPLIDAR